MAYTGPQRFQKMRKQTDGTYKRVGGQYTKSKRGRKIPVKATGPFAAKVNKVIMRSRETKLVIGPPVAFTTNDTLAAFTDFSTAITGVNEIYMCLPAVPQGTGDFQRVGNEIQPTSLTTKVNLSLVARSQLSMSIFAHVFFLTSKNIKDWKLTAGVPITQMLDLGDGTNTQFNGGSYAGLLPINKSEFNVIAHKKILLQKASGNPNNIYQNDEEAATSTCRHFATFSQKIPLPKELLYLNASETRPTNSFPFMVVGFTATDNMGDRILDSLILRVQAQSHLYYKDA